MAKSLKPNSAAHISTFCDLCVILYLGKTSHKKIDFFRALPKLPLPPSPQFGQVVQLFLDVKNDVFARITEPSNDDYDNDVSDNCDNNFGTFDDFGVKNDQKVSHNMILMSKYKGQHGGKKGQKIRARPTPPPLFGQCPKEIDFSYGRSSLNLNVGILHT